MTADVAVSIDSLGKKYLLGQLSGRPDETFREMLSSAVRSTVRRAATSPRPPDTAEFWALRDVSFDVAKGEVIGIVGRNGAGKSTLLKILSRITEPSEGSVLITGRVASLLEVGTGFHPDLTGRENIFLNGSILGMTRAEVRAKFDEIVLFAGVAKFLDTPVKRYSSGMYVRLAFAVAAHLEPEILIVDEVLAVGDQEFQAKCLGKMREVSKSERTVLFVSHNLAAVRALCDRAVLLDAGRMIDVGKVGPVLDSYISRQNNSVPEINLNAVTEDKPYIERIQLMSPAIWYGDCVEFMITLMSPVHARVGMDIRLDDEHGSAIAYFSTHMISEQIELEGGVRLAIKLSIGPLNLAVGSYDVFFSLIRPAIEDLHIVSEPLRFGVLHADPGKTGFEFRQSYGLGSFSAPLALEIIR